MRDDEGVCVGVDDVRDVRAAGRWWQQEAEWRRGGGGTAEKEY